MKIDEVRKAIHYHGKLILFTRTEKGRNDVYRISVRPFTKQLLRKDWPSGLVLDVQVLQDQIVVICTDDGLELPDKILETLPA